MARAAANGAHLAQHPERACRAQRAGRKLFLLEQQQRGNAMHVLAIRRPGQRGTQKLLTRYGDRLVCVRYRYDAAAGKRYKTVEIILDEAAWTPPPPHPEATKFVPKADYIDDLDAPPEHREVGVKVFFRENELRERVKAAGARWSKTDKLWQMPYETALSLGLEHRIARR